ncbi:uncharacterized protein LOC135924415 [Gordionus sp. m RMFG-2023]|uniref:uncharacterized protein LOC135924415 n=1 Tax=Gordionus sp. m RMFG-2023 TaxID=3053472 RepID=UPI0031FBCACF
MEGYSLSSIENYYKVSTENNNEIYSFNQLSSPKAERSAFLNLVENYHKVAQQSLSTDPPSFTGNVDCISKQILKFCSSRVADRKRAIEKAISEINPVIQDILKEIEIQEPRFISSLNANSQTGRFDGLTVVGGLRFEVNLFLNQMGVFNFVDDGSSPGCSVLKLSDGRKRSMSLWVEFITASGYLSARKIRARFHSLLVEACDKVESKYKNKSYHDFSKAYDGMMDEGQLYYNSTSKESLKFYQRYISDDNGTWKSKDNIYEGYRGNWEGYHDNNYGFESSKNYYRASNHFKTSGDSKMIKILTKFEDDGINFVQEKNRASDTYTGYPLNANNKAKTPKGLEDILGKNKQENNNRANADVTISLWNKYLITIVPAFKCQGMWPRSANSWPATSSCGTKNCNNFSHQIPPNRNTNNFSHNYNKNPAMVSNFRMDEQLICKEINNSRCVNCPSQTWPHHNLITRAKSQGFTLVSREPYFPSHFQVSHTEDIDETLNDDDIDQNIQFSKILKNSDNLNNNDTSVYLSKTKPGTGKVAPSPTNQASAFNNPSAIEGDTWLMVFTEAEDVLLNGGCRRICYRILKTLRDRHLDKIPGRPITAYLLKTLLLFECEKHPYEEAWNNKNIRLTGILLQLISCLQCKKCPHYFLPAVDLLKDHHPFNLNYAARETWKLVRAIILNPSKCWEEL